MKKKERKKGAQKKGGENSPVSPPLDPRLGNGNLIDAKTETTFVPKASVTCLSLA